jgi:adenosine deaminase
MFISKQKWLIGVVSCFHMFSIIHQVTDNVVTLRKLTSEVIEDFAQENVRYLEIRTTPRENPQTKMSKEEYVQIQRTKNIIF